MGAVELEVVDVFQVGWNDVVCGVNQGLVQVDQQDQFLVSKEAFAILLAYFQC